MEFSIPEEYRHKVERIEVTDHRSNAEILATFQEHKPVTSEKNVWAYWHSGVANMPKWCQNNVVDWVRILGPEWTVRVLDNVAGSPNNTLGFVSEDLLPPAFVDRTMDGIYLGQHGADLTRSSCLYLHGGVWLDVGIILIRHLDRICWNQLEDPNSSYLVALPIIYGLVPSNHFVAARKHDPFIYKWHQLFTHLWGDKKNCKGILSGPLLGPVIPMLYEGADPKWNMDWIDPAVMLEYSTHIICLTRLFCIADDGEGFSGLDYWKNKILAFSGMEEHLRGEFVTSFVGAGERGLNVLQLPRSGVDTTSETYKTAEKITWEMLANASMWKVFHAHGLTHSVHLGMLLDRPENEGKDSMPGTFGELLRYGTVHLRQTREEVVMMPKLTPSQTWHKGVLEP